MVRSRASVSLLLAALVALPALAVAQTDGRDRCDFNGDGRVDDREKMRCTTIADRCDTDHDGSVSADEKAACADAVRDRCDTDGDGTVDADEKAACAPTTYHRCDFDHDGIVSEAEKTKCEAAFDRCDTDQDGAVSHEEHDACASDLREKCDFNGDGVVSPEERFRCSSTAQPCDFNADGAVSEDEKLRCAQTHHCDADQDGTITEDEKSHCLGDGHHDQKPCDFNGDGLVDEVEHRRCASDAPMQHCDLDESGDVDDAEKAHCAGAIRDHCDFDGDGAVTDRERQRCAVQAELRDRCDFDGDGAVGPDERDACEDELRARCDFNKDGTLQPDEAERCRAILAGEDAAHAPVADDCRAALGELRERMEAFESKLRERRATFLTQQEAAVKAFAAEEHTQEEWAEFRATMAARRDVAEAEFADARAAAEAEARAMAEKCEGQFSAAGHGCRPDEATFTRFQNYIEEQERLFRADAEERIQRFKLFQDELARKLEGASEAEAKALHDEIVRARGVFEHELDEAALRHRAAIERQWEEFKERAARACLQDADGAEHERGFKEIQEDHRGERLACGLDIQAKLDAFYETNGKDASQWTDAQLGDYLAVKADAHRLREACEDRIHANWKKDVGTRFEARARHERLGSFEIEDAGGTGHARGRFVSFDFEGGSITIREFTVQGVLLFRSFYAPHSLDDMPHADGSVLKVSASTDSTHASIRIADNPTGSFDVVCAPADTLVAGDPEACRLVFDDAAAITPSAKGEEGHAKYAVTMGERRATLMLRGAHEWTGNALEFRGGLRLFAPSDNFVLDKVANKERERIEAAVEEEKVLAEITITAGADDVPVAEFVPLGVGVTSEEGEHEADPCLAAAEGAVTFELAGLKCGVVKPLEGGTGIDVIVSAESDEPKTLVFNLDIGLFKLTEGQTLDADDVVVQYYDLAADGTPTRVDVTQADDIVDVLDPSEDAPEYWVVLDEDGLQLLLSNSHFSAKQITVSTAGSDAGNDASPAPPSGEATASGSSQTPGVGLLAIVAALGAVAVALRARGRT